MVCCIADNPNLPILPKCVRPIAIIHLFLNFSYSRFQEDGYLRVKQRTGAPQTADLDRAIVQRSINNPKMTSIEIARTEGV